MRERVVSVDIFRGLTIVLMVLVNTPGTWSHVYAPFLHAQWHGYTPTDLVFPFFMFIVGISIVFSYHGKKPNTGIYKKISIRTLKLIGLGVFLGAFTIYFPFFKDLEAIRFPGVLQRIAIGFFFASLLFLHVNWKGLIFVCITILVGYWIWMGYIPLNGLEPTYERAPNNWANYIDLQVFGSHMYKPDYDPEGLLSSLPSIATSLLGIFTGLILISKRKKKEVILALGGIVMIIVGHLWDATFPINKALWTSSFVLVTAGWANVILALIYFLTDVNGIRFGKVFSYAGANAIILYFLSSFISKILYSIQIDQEGSMHSWLFNTLYVHEFLSMEFSSLLYGLSVVGFYIFLAYILYKRKIFVKV